jgi:hypothetical protein
MILKASFVKTTAALTLLLYMSGMVVAPLVPKAHALFWEDETDSNDPKEVKQRPSHFFLLDWVDDLNKDSTKNRYKELDNHDKGPGVNAEARTMVVVASGIVGLGAGIFIANRFSADGSDVSSNMFIGGALGLVSGIAIGALIMPRNYEVDRRAQIDYMKQRQAWMADPLRLEVQKAFHASDVTVSFKF